MAEWPDYLRQKIVRRVYSPAYKGRYTDGTPFIGVRLECGHSITIPANWDEITVPCGECEDQLTAHLSTSRDGERS